MEHKLNVFLQEVPGAFNKNLYIFLPTIKPGVMKILYSGGKTKEYEIGSAINEPTLVLSPEMMEMLMEELLSQGIKPPAHSFVEGKLEATEAHLKDMRALVFKDQVEFQKILDGRK